MDTDERAAITEVEFEKLLDAAVQRHLNQDPRYRNADNAEEQAEAEEAIGREQLDRLDSLFRVA